MLLGILLIILTLYGLLLFWVLNERLRELYRLVTVVKERIEKLEKKLSLDFKNEGGENREKGSLEDSFSFHLLRKENEEEERGE